jgi:hypothetical protein
MAYIGTQPNNVKKNIGLYNPSEILQLTKDGSWGGSLELIQSQTYSSTVSAVDFTSIKENVYDVHYLQMQNSGNVSDNKRMTCRFFESGVLETASVYQRACQVGKADGSFAEVNSTSADELRLCDNTGGNATGEKANSYAYFYNLGNASKYSFMTYNSIVCNITGSASMEFGGGVLPQTSVVDGIRVLVNDDSDFDSFTMTLYGIKQI